MMRVQPFVPIVLVASCASGQEYFRPGSLGATVRENQFKAEWYGKQLAALREDSLWTLSREHPDMRVLGKPAMRKIASETERISGTPALGSTQGQNSGRFVLVELCDEDSAPAEQVLNHEEWKIALLDVDHFRRPPEVLTHCNEVEIRSDD